MEGLDVVAIGHALIDIRFVVDSFPLPDQEGVILNQSRGAGGSAINVAIDVKRLGLSSGIMAKIGFDGFGRLVVDELMKEGVDVSGLKIGFKETGFSIVVIDGEGQIVMYGFKGSAEELKPEEIEGSIIRRARFVHIASLRIDTSIQAARIARKFRKKVSWDPGRVLAKKGLKELENLARLVDLILVNEQECKDLTGVDDFKRGAEMIRGIGPKTIVVKRGDRGIYVSSDHMMKEIPAYRVEKPVDTTGAGDAFAAGLLTGLARGYELRESLRYGLAVAALKVTRLGSHEVPHHDEVIKFMRDVDIFSSNFRS